MILFIYQVIIIRGVILWKNISGKSFESLKENKIQRKTPNLMTTGFEVDRDYKLKFVRTFLPINGND